MNKKNPIKEMRNKLEDILLPGEVIYPIDQSTQIGHELQSYYWVTNMSRLISSYGNIWRVVKTFENQGGYQHAVLRTTDGNYANVLAHRMLAAAITDDMEYFHTHEVDHLSGDKDNNSAENIELVDHDVNVQRAYDNGLKKSITDADIIYIMKRCREVYPTIIDAELAEEFGVKPVTIKYIRLGRDKYKYRLQRLGLEPIKKKEFSISDDQISYIMKEVDKVFPKNIDGDLAKTLNISIHTVIDIRTGCGNYGDRLKKLGFSPIKYPKGLSDWHIHKVFELVNAGKSDDEIAKELGIAKITVTMIRNGNGIYRDRLIELNIQAQNRHSGKIPLDTIRYIMERSKEAYPNKIDKELAEELKVSEFTIMHIRSGLYEYGDIIRGLGYTPILYSAKTTNKITDDIIKEVIRMAKMGYSDEEIAKKVDRSPVTVRNIRTGNVNYIDRIKALKLEPVVKFQ